LRIEALLEKLRDLDVSDLEIPKGLPVLSVEELVGEGLKNLRNTDSHICAGAIQDLTALARYSDLVVPALTPMLDKDKSEYTRRVAAGCLAYIGAKAKSALPLLKQGLDDPDANIRNSFQQALEQFEKAQELPGDEQRIQLELAILKEIDEVRKTAGASK
jgi:HEAT repeat protein